MTHDEPVIRRPAKPGDKAGPRRRVYVYGAVGAAVAVVVVVVLLIVLGGDDGVVDPGWLDDAASGKVVYCSGEDVSGSQQRSVADFNKSPEHGTAHAVLAADIPPKADRQRAEYLKRIRSHDCDVVYLDVIYTPEFASTDLLYDMTPYLERDDLASSFDSKMISTATYGGKLWGVPKQLDAGLLYYRRDKVRRGPPATWRALVKAAKPGRGELPGLRLQLDAYEGLTVTFLELAYAAGADPIVSDDGKADLDQPGTLKALELLHDAIVDRAVPGSVTRLAEENSLDLFSLGRAKFLRGWPYVEARVRGDAEHAAQTDSPSAQARRNTVFNLGVASLPPWTVGGRHVAILGGHNLVIPRKAKNPQGALHLIEFLTSDQQILRDARKASLAPVVPALNDNDAVRSSPALMAVQDDDLRLRPPITSYWRVSRAISTRLRQVLNNRQAKSTFPQELRDLQADVQRELDQ